MVQSYCLNIFTYLTYFLDGVRMQLSGFYQWQSSIGRICYQQSYPVSFHCFFLINGGSPEFDRHIYELPQQRLCFNLLIERNWMTILLPQSERSEAADKRRIDDFTFIKTLRYSPLHQPPSSSCWRLQHLARTCLTIVNNNYFSEQ